MIASRFCRALTIGCLLWSVAVAARAAHAQGDPTAPADFETDQSDKNPVTVARTHFRRAVDSFADGDFATARIEFERAYMAVPNWRLLYNLAQVAQELRDYPAAERYYVRYVEDGADAVEGSRQQEIARELAKVRARIATVRLTSNLDGAEVFLDDVSVGKTPLKEPLRVSTGQRRVTLKSSGYGPTTQVIEPAGGEALDVHVELLPVQRGPSAPLAVSELMPPSMQDQRSSLNALPLVLAIGTVALGAGAGVFAVLAASDASDYRAALKRSTTFEELAGLSDSAKNKALVSDVLLVATAVGAATFVIVLTQQGMVTRESASLHISPGRLELHGRF